MASLGERTEALEMRVGRLETWSGPGQVEALAQGQRELRAQLRTVERVQERHTRMLADLKADVAVLKADVSEVKSTLREVLRRLPPPPAG